jgi:hypothetical protein
MLISRSATWSIGYGAPSGARQHSKSLYGSNHPSLATPLSWEEPFRPVALRLRLSANLPFSVERDSAQCFFFTQTVADERPTRVIHVDRVTRITTHRSKFFHDAKLPNDVVLDERRIETILHEMSARAFRQHAPSSGVREWTTSG